MRIIAAIAMAIGVSVVCPSALGQTIERPIYGSPPDSFVVPESWTAHSIESAVGNLVQWRNSKPATDIGRVGGYFMVVHSGPAFNAGTVVRGEWRQDRDDSLLRARLVSGSSACAISDAVVNLSDLTYLGPWFDRVWPQLGLEISAHNGATPAREVLFSDLRLIASDRPSLERLLPPAYYGSGEARYFCAINIGGVLECTLVDESPADSGLGDAGLSMLRFARVQSLSGEFVEGKCTRISIVFNINERERSAQIRAGVTTR